MAFTMKFCRPRFNVNHIPMPSSVFISGPGREICGNTNTSLVELELHEDARKIK
jgi:hypothetical protein